MTKQPKGGLPYKIGVVLGTAIVVVVVTLGIWKFVEVVF